MTTTRMTGMTAGIFLSLLFLISIISAFPVDSLAQNLNPLAQATAKSASTPAKSGDLSKDDAVNQIRAKIADAERIYREALETSSSGVLPQGATREKMAEQLLSMRWLIRTLQNRITFMEELSTARKRKEDLRREASMWSGFAEKPPYSILLCDSIRDSIQSAKIKLEASETSCALIAKLIEEEKDSLKDSEKSIRQISEKMESEKDKLLAAGLRMDLELEKLKSRLAAARLSNHELRKSIFEEDGSENRILLDFLGKQLSVASSSVSFRKEDLDKVIGYLNIELEKVMKEIEDAELEYPRLVSALEVSRTELKNAIDGGPLGKTDDAKSRKEAIERMEDLVETKLALLETGAKRVEILRMLSAGINMDKSIWEMRFSSYRSGDFKHLQECYDKQKAYLDKLKLFEEYFNRQIVITSNLISEEMNRIQERKLSMKGGGDSSEKLVTYKQRDELNRRIIDSIDKAKRLLLRWRESLDFDRKSLPFGGRMRDLLSGLSLNCSKLWNFEVFSAEDTITVDGQQMTGRRSVTAGKILEVLITLFVGYFICCFVAYLSAKFLKRKFAIDERMSRSWLKFFLIMILAVFSMMAAKIPLTVFAFAGGALAIGLGFGMQNLLKNFISGIIILIEQPLRVGDVVEVAGTVGVVTGISLRSSLIRNSNGIEKFVPNSTLLENDVINWTHSNRHVRFNVKVGVAYGSPPEKVMEILEGIAVCHREVQKSPSPKAMLEDFGDNTLDFILNYWVNVLPETDTRQIASDLRMMIEKRLGEEGISIAYPQRDIHLDTVKPLKVEILHGDKPSDLK